MSVATDYEPASADRVRGRAFTLATALLWLQGGYYVLTGAWPLISIRTFQMVTGPKTDHLQAAAPTEADHWLVMTVGVLVTATGVALLAAAWRRSAPPEIVVLAIGAAVGLTAVEVIYVLREVIAPIYLADAAAEMLLVAAWAVAVVRRRTTESAAR